MPVTYDRSNLPPERVEVNGCVWKRDEYDTDTFQWMREMDEDDWDKDDIDVVGGGEPIRMVTLQLLDDTWEIQECETGGPNYHRPGFCEVISSEYTATATADEEAHDEVMDGAFPWMREIAARIRRLEAFLEENGADIDEFADVDSDIQFFETHAGYRA